MRSLLPLPARAARRGLLGACAATLVALTSACSFITGIPNVTDVTVSVTPAVIPAGVTAQAIGTAYGNGHKILQTSKITVGYSTSNPAVATVNPNTGVVVGVSQGVAVITATAKDKRDTAVITVTPAIPTNVTVTPPNVSVGETVTLDIRPTDATGQPLVGRKPTVTSSNPAVLQVKGSGTTTVTVTGITVGVVSLTVDVDGRVTSLTTSVAPVRPTASDFKLVKSANTLIEGESSQTILSLRDATGAPISTTTQSISYVSDDITVATVSPSGVVTGVRAGTTTIRANIAGTTHQPIFTVTVNALPARFVSINNRGPFLRLNPDGTGVPSVRIAGAADSLGRLIPGRLITYISRDPSIFTVSPSGIVTGKAFGSAWLVASADNGVAADSIRLRVTELPILAAQIAPRQPAIYPDQTVQFTVTLTDSLLNTVTSNNVQWFASPAQNLVITQTGLATARQSGNATVSVQVNQVSGIPTFIGDQVSVTILPTPVASIEVAPTNVQVKVNQSTSVSITPRDVNGAALFNRTVNAKADDPSIVFVNGAGQIAGLKAGTTTVTYQALNGSNPEGTPATITVTVTP
jgi:uncharacterized protein YjdB